MIEVDQDAFRATYERRLLDWYGGCCEVTQWVEHFVRLRLARWDEAQERHLFEVDGEVVALMVVGPPTMAQLVEASMEAALRAAIEWAAARADRLTVTLPPDSPAFYERLPLRATGMLKTLPRVPPAVDGVTARAMTEAEFEPWLERQMADYVREMVDSGLLGADDARARAKTQFDQALPEGARTAGQSFLCLQAGGEVVGTNWVTHEYEPRTSWIQGVEIGAEHRGKGYGRAAMLLGEAASIEAGDAQLGLNVFGHNEVAMNLYHSLGCRTVEVFRSIELRDASGGVPAGDQRRGQQEDPDGGSA